MAKTIEDNVRELLGNLALQNAQLQTQVGQLQEQLVALLRQHDKVPVEGPLEDPPTYVGYNSPDYPRSKE